MVKKILNGNLIGKRKLLIYFFSFSAVYIWSLIVLNKCPSNEILQFIGKFLEYFIWITGLGLGSNALSKFSNQNKPK